MNNLTETDMFIVIVLISIIVVLIAVIALLDYASKKKKKEALQTKEIDSFVQKEEEKIVEKTEVNEQLSNNLVTPIEEKQLVTKEKTNRIEEIRYVEEDEELEKTKAKIELEELKEELRRQEEAKKLEEIKIAEVLETQIETNDVKEKVEQVAIIDNNKNEEIEVIETLEIPKREVEVIETLEMPTSELEKEEIEKLSFDNQAEVSEIANAINEQLIKEETEIKEANLQKVNEVQEDLIELLEIGIEEKIAEHEDEQERKAIISVEEFNKISDTMYENNEIIQNAYGDEGDEPISLTELENLYNAKEAKTVKLENFNVIEEPQQEVILKETDFKKMADLPPIADEKKFKSSPFISPVYGISETKETIELEQTANLDKLNDEIKKTNEFLKTLKELQKNLD